MSGRDAPRPAPPRSRVLEVFPYPFVGTFVILIALVLLTPVLFSNGSLPPSFLTRAVLLVDRVGGPNATSDFFVTSVALTAVYARIDIGVATGFAWNNGTVVWPTNFSWQNVTQRPIASVSVSGNPAAIEVIALYTAGGSSVEYAGILAFNVTGSGASEAIAFAVSPLTSSVTVPTPLLVSDLPVVVALQNFGSGGP